MKSARICVIGAGCSGITAIKNLVEAGLTNVVCYEKGDQIGGNWVYTASESHSSVCETTHIISSKKMSEYLDFPMPDEYPDYPSHDQVLEYFKSYCRHFNLYPYIRLNSTVRKVTKLEVERWSVELENGQTEIFDYLLVANGHHAEPRHPEFKDDFKGKYLHSHQFKNNRGFENQRVLVVGAGNSACDCAVEISRVASHVGISIRTPQYIVPKFFLGKPTDTFNENLLWLPKPIAGFLRRLTLRIQMGSLKNYQLQQPKHDVIEAHPTLNSELLYKIKHGKVHPRIGIEKIEGNSVFFTDGKKENYDILLAATGYYIATPFFAKDFLDYSDADRVPLYLRMFHSNHPSLIFIGLVQPQGAVWPLSDRQSIIAANYIAGNWDLPKNIHELSEKDADEIDKSFIKRKRHTIEVHYHPYAKKLDREIKRLKKRRTKSKTYSSSTSTSIS